jgi:hypothetical protein
MYVERTNRKIHDALQIRDWKYDEWPLEQIIQYYGSATWTEDGSWGYHTPIYMCNCIIGLHGVFEIITNETAKALNILSKQQTKIHNAIYQNCLALNYLHSEGGICDKFNLSNYYLQIDAEGKANKEIMDNMKKLACVPAQTWNGWSLSDLFGAWF